MLLHIFWAQKEGYLSLDKNEIPVLNTRFFHCTRLGPQRTKRRSISKNCYVNLIIYANPLLLSTRKKPNTLFWSSFASIFPITAQKATSYHDHKSKVQYETYSNS